MDSWYYTPTGIWYYLHIHGVLFRQIGVDIYSQIVLRGAVYRSLLHYQFPQSVLLCGS